MKTLFDVLYTYALEERLDIYYLFQDKREREDNEKMIKYALESIEKQGFQDEVRRIEDGINTRTWLDQRSAFWAGLSIAMELSRLSVHTP